jgi:hypothetical protein
VDSPGDADSPVELVGIRDVFLRGQQRSAAILEAGRAAWWGQLR